MEDFNSAHLTKEIQYRQHITCATREGNILDHCYITIKRASHAVMREAEQSLVLFIPTYRNKLKTNKPVNTTVRVGWWRQ